MTAFQIWERRARYTMAALTALLAVNAFLFKAGWISHTASYRDSAWYSAREHAGFIITTEHADEAGCKVAAQQPGVTCRSGRVLGAAHDKAVSG